jgi:hypothetical protein
MHKTKPLPSLEQFLALYSVNFETMKLSLTLGALLFATLCFGQSNMRIDSCYFSLDDRTYRFYEKVWTRSGSSAYSGWISIDSLALVDVNGNFFPYVSSFYRPKNCADSIDGSSSFNNALCYQEEYLEYPKQLQEFFLVDTIETTIIEGFTHKLNQLRYTDGSYEDGILLRIVGPDLRVRQFAFYKFPNLVVEELKQIRPGSYLLLQFPNYLKVCWYFK